MLFCQLDIVDVREALGAQQLLYDLGRVANDAVFLDSDRGYSGGGSASTELAVVPKLETTSPPRPNALAHAILAMKRRRLCGFGTATSEFVSTA